MEYRLSFTRHQLDSDCEFFESALPPEIRPDFDGLWSLHPESFPRITIHGREVPIPRWQQAYGADYYFSAQVSRALPIPDSLVPILDWSTNEIDSRINGLLLNWYDGSLGHYIGPHRDSTKDMAPGAPIVTVSLGETRIFRLSSVKGNEKFDFEAKNGTVFVLPQETNQSWKHEVPKRARYKGRRISVTLRAFEQVSLPESAAE